MAEKMEYYTRFKYSQKCKTKDKKNENIPLILLTLHRSRALIERR
jgi:hypothetical protein